MTNTTEIIPLWLISIGTGLIVVGLLGNFFTAHILE